jgi:hypothetical protein
VASHIAVTHASRALAGHPALGSHAALGGVGLGGGGGLAHLLVHLLIWRAIWRLGLLIWRVPTFGPGIVLLIVLALVALAIFRARRGRGWPGPRWPGQGRRGPFGDRAGDQGPRDW